MKRQTQHNGAIATLINVASTTLNHFIAHLVLCIVTFASNQAYELDPDNVTAKKQINDVRAAAEGSKFSCEQEMEWLKSDNREQLKREAGCAQQ